MSDKTVVELLEEAAKTFEERNRVYGDNMMVWGNVAMELFPDGLDARNFTAEDWSRFGFFMQLVNKCVRYAANFEQGGHQDSARDAIVYAAMLESVTK